MSKTNLPSQLPSQLPLRTLTVRVSMPVTGLVITATVIESYIASTILEPHTKLALSQTLLAIKKQILTVESGTSKSIYVGAPISEHKIVTRDSMLLAIGGVDELIESTLNSGSNGNTNTKSLPKSLPNLSDADKLALMSNEEQAAFWAAQEALVSPVVSPVVITTNQPTN